MRFSAEDRRQLARRIKNRLPAVLTSIRLRRIPQLMLVISATVFLTPEAKARIAANEVTPVFTKIYSKEELQKKLPPNPVNNLGDRILAEVSEVFKTITAVQGADWQKGQIEALKTKQADKATWDMAAARMKEAPVSTKTNSVNFRTYLAGETQKAGSTRAGTYLPVLDKVKSGLNMNLDLSSYFSSADGKKPASGNVRYGLVLADIIPARAAFDRVSLGDAQEEMQFAGHADVRWTIGALDEEQGRKLFSFDDAVSSGPSSDSFWTRFKIPKFKFNTKLKPESVENLAALKAETMPIWRFDVAQDEGLVNLTYRMKTNGNKVAQEQTFNIPVAGTLALGRRFSDNWQVVQTSAYNVLFDKRMPLVSVHYMHVEERYKGDIAKQIDASTRIAISGKARATGKVLEKGEGDRPEQYSLEYLKTF